MTLRALTLAVISTLSFSVYAADAPATATTTTPAQPQAQTQQQLTTNTDKISYAIGVDIGRNFKSQNIALNPQILAQGVKDGVAGDKTLMNPKDMQDTLVDFQKELIAKRDMQVQQIAQKNKAESDTFLTENKKKTGVITLADGLQYKIIKEGVGNPPTENDSVTVNYEGTFPNGQVFDSSYTRGKPVSFGVSQVIPGWTQALKMMKPGAEWMLYVPANLAYGDHGAGPIGPNQTLVFKVELISVQSQAATAATTTQTSAAKAS